ncbi:cation-independent mannose-6-phosphate receptor-like isoform X2 [Mya arenaria]|uniref:cation-independent mannose-6-phosphate receptor-like isoform X2 n=1 Tax=Mya arenaria TaxID=6604 RepID=UPI0022E78150|nr:cation-independent mannose-6-phosphate receptor-like isoform X2 [Mya arenaria]
MILQGTVTVNHMKMKETIVCLIFLLVFGCNIISECVAFECQHLNTSFIPLSGEWISKTDGKFKKNVTYTISLCGPINSKAETGNSCVSGTAICMTYDNGTSLSAGSFASERDEIPGVHNEEIGESWLAFAGDICPENTDYNMTTLINIKCGLTKGSPKFLDNTGCVNYFEWETNVMCKHTDDDPLPNKEVRCYYYDNHKRYDLSPLAMKKGGYLISSELDTDIYINICRDINPVGPTQGCPAGSGACKVQGAGTASATHLELGSPVSDLAQDKNGRLVLVYKSEETPAGCTSPPTTTIEFICPDKGQSKDPMVTEDFDCQYVVEWQTEYACEERTLTNSSCLLSSPRYDLDFDLRPLTLPPGKNYKVSYDKNGDAYNYFINVCAETGIQCPDEEHKRNIPACQISQKNSDYGKSMGSTDHMSISYVDNDLVLTYKGGDGCEHNRMQRQTVINFKCNMSAENNGAGNPKFNREGDCIYFFDWDTKYACIDHPVGEECGIKQGNQRYDFSSLIKTTGSNWLALHDGDTEATSKDFYINVCHTVLRSGEASRCDPGAAICLREHLSTKNLGRYEKAPFYNEKINMTQIVYSNGDVCGDGRITSTITFICMPGSEESAPVLIHVSTDECKYEFEWHTAVACELGHFKGDNCRVQGNGFMIDLSPLKKAGKDNYKADSPTDSAHDYLVNVCGPLQGTGCDGLQEGQAGVCQVPTTGDGESFNAGQFTQQLTYYDGMINLTYTGGTPYHDTDKTPRQSEINFLCDRNAGMGNPKFLVEAASNHSYLFEWRTAFACPGTPMECVVEDKVSGTQYDLSSLARSSDEENWSVAGPTSGSKFYLNVCGPLNSVGKGTGCSALASVCSTTLQDGKEQVDNADLGRVSTGLAIEVEGRLKLRYESPGLCHNGSASVPYVTNIHFICQKDAMSSGPQTPVKDGPCEFTFTWLTSAACPLTRDKEVSNRSCSVKDPNSDYVFNLQPLNKTGPYEVKSGDMSFLLSICGSISTDRCPGIPVDDKTVPAGVCELATIKQALAEPSTDLDFSKTGKMVLKFDGKRNSNGERVNVEVEFECDSSLDLGTPEFVALEGITYRFQFRTSLVCAPRGTDCVVQDDAGHQYDLTQLARDTWWKAVDSRGSQTYYINVCRPVNNAPGTSCPDGPIGGCQSAANNRSFNIGYIHSKPVANDGTLSLHYRNGDLCHVGTPNQAHRSTTINFVCGSTEQGPVFMEETETCEYVFNWVTPAACPLQRIVGKDCHVTDPRYGYQFDLTPLRKAGTDYRVKDGEYEYVLNACGALVDSTTCGEGAGACQTKPNSDFTSITAGKANSSIMYSNGELTVTYLGGKANCHGQYERQTIIKFTCDASKDGTDGPIFIEESYNCKYVFEWPTHRACPPWKAGACALSNGGNNYDLFDLTMTNDNYEARDGDIKYIINVCRSVIHQKNALCPYDSAVCMVDTTKLDNDTNKYQDLGEPNSDQISFEAGHLVLTYTGGITCDSSGGKMKTVILFQCDPQAKDTSPGDHFMVGECEHHFTWTTSAACPMGEVNNPTILTSNITCQVKNPRSEFVFDLTSLRSTSTPWKIEHENHKYEFNVCGPLKGSVCHVNDSNIGVCQSETSDSQRAYNGGDAVHDLFYDNGNVVQELSGGDPCHNNQFKRSTYITFVCNDHHGIGRPVFQGETDDCTYYISWSTNLVCENDVKCTVDTGSGTLDLSSLSRVTDKVVTSTYDGSTFYLSVCSPLTPTAGLLCPPGAAVCQVKPGNTNLQVSLGKPSQALDWDAASQTAILRYVNGNQCDTDTTRNFTSKIVFSCGTDPRSSPVFVSKDDCVFTFSWSVPNVCVAPASAAPPTVNMCGFNDKSLGQTYDFKQLGSKTYEVNDPSSNEIYVVRMCGNITSGGYQASCNGAMVCRKRDGLSFGAARNFHSTKEENAIKFTYAEGEKCSGDRKAESHIRFECDRTVKDGGKPEFLDGIGCDIELVWKTDVVCPIQFSPCRTISDGHVYDLSLLSKTSGAWNITDADKNDYWFNVCGSLKGSSIPGECGSGSVACRKSGDDITSLGSFSAGTDLYMDSHTNTLVLEYKNGGDACPKHRSDNSRPANTRIVFSCGSTIGAPVLKDSDYNKDRCIFEFTWNTSLACKVQRQNVTVVNGMVKDPRSGIAVNLAPIWDQQFKYKQQGTVFELTLNGSTSHCSNGAVVCLNRAKNNKVLGMKSHAAFFMEDERVEARYSTDTRCSGDLAQENVTSVIQFVCSSNNIGPRLIHNSSECLYVFNWETTAACLTASITLPIPANPSAGGQSTDGKGGLNPGATGAPSSKKGGLSGKTVGSVVATFFALIVFCVLLVVFHRKERRETCFNNMRGLFSRTNRREYSQLRYQRVNIVIK